MRRNDREVTDPRQIQAILDRCACCRLGFYDGAEVYIVPLNFGYERRGEELYFYFHGAKEGRKLDLIRSRPRVGFELDTDYALVEAPAACGHTARYASIIGTGTVELLTEPEEKRRGLQCLMAHVTGREDWTFPALDAVCVFRLRVETLSCKVNA